MFIHVIQKEGKKTTGTHKRLHIPECPKNNAKEIKNRKTITTFRTQILR